MVRRPNLLTSEPLRIGAEKRVALRVRRTARLGCWTVVLLSLVPIGACVHRTRSHWPPSTWDRAEVVLFNHVRDGPEIPRVAFGHRGWSPHVVERRPIDIALAFRAVALVSEVRGDAIMTKCPFPRHAIVFFNGETPVASANFDVAGRDLIIWPGYGLTDEEESARWQFRASEQDPETVMAAWVFEYDSGRWLDLFKEAGVAVDPWPCGHLSPVSSWRLAPRPRP
jgi:hypothetical protein